MTSGTTPDQVEELRARRRTMLTKRSMPPRILTIPTHWNPSLSHSWCNETSVRLEEWRRSNLLTATPRLRGTGFGNGSAPSRVGSSGAIGYAKVSGGRPYAPLPWPQHLPPWLSCGSRFSPILTAWIFPAFLGWREALEERNRPPGGCVGSRRKRQNRSSKKTENDGVFVADLTVSYIAPYAPSNARPHLSVDHNAPLGGVPSMGVTFCAAARTRPPEASSDFCTSGTYSLM